MIIRSIQDLSNQHIVGILEKEFSKITDPAIVENYHPKHSRNPGNLFFILENGRYKIGNYSVILDDDENFIASAGWNQYELDHSVALLLTRMYVSPQHRTQYYIGNHILPVALIEAAEYKHKWITCNEHTIMIYEWFTRAAQKKRSALYSDWPDIYKKFRPIGKKNIYYIDQYVAEYTGDYNAE